MTLKKIENSNSQNDSLNEHENNNNENTNNNTLNLNQNLTEFVNDSNTSSLNSSLISNEYEHLEDNNIIQSEDNTPNKENSLILNSNIPNNSSFITQFRLALQNQTYQGNGEDDYSRILEGNCKAYRFINSSNEWKERGKGEYRVLKHNQKEAYYMFIFRMKKTLKLMLKFIIDDKITCEVLNANNKCVIINNAIDYSDSNNVLDSNENNVNTNLSIFSLKFSDEELCDQFYSVFKQIKLEV